MKTIGTVLFVGIVIVLGPACGQAERDDSVEGRETPRAAKPTRALAASPSPALANPVPAQDCQCAHDAPDTDPAPAPVDVHVGTAPTKGALGAPVTIVVFSDFQCPYCARAEKTLMQIEKVYGDKVRFAFRNQPLPFHDGARPAARAALAAGQQGKFWEYHDALFAHQESLDRDSLEAYASELGLDLGRFRTALDSQEVGAQLDADLAEARRVSVVGTPTFFVNGRRVVGAQPLERFEALIDEALVAGR